jgi:hypothetical protein
LTTRDPGLLAVLHLRWRCCALCGETWPLSLHHVSNKPRNDVEANLVMVCGSGTTGCHGLITVNDDDKRRELALYLREKRPDTLAYLEETFPREGADNWLQRVLGS